MEPGRGARRSYGLTLVHGLTDDEGNVAVLATARTTFSKVTDEA
jgi:hypothetical protein